MQRNVTDILTEWFYRLPNGYAIQPYNAKELKVLEEVLNDQGIPSYPVIKYLQEIDQLDQAFLDAKPIKEDEPMKGMQIPDAAKATATTVTHETYFAIAMAYIIANNAITTPKTEDEFVEIANRTGKYLKDRKNTIQTALNYMRSAVHAKDDSKKNKKYRKGDSVYYTEKDGNVLGPIFIDQWEDASKAAIATKNAIDKLYEPSKYISALRVSTTGEYGVADDVVTIELQDNNKDDVHVSLKYGKGQFSSISIDLIFQKLYGIELSIEGSKRNGLIRFIYDNKNPGAVNNALQSYISNIHAWLDTLSEVPANTQKWLDANKTSAQTNEMGLVDSNMTWDEWDNAFGRGKNTVAYNYRKIYDTMNKDNGGLAYKEAIRKDRAKFLHPAIETLFLELEAGGRVDDVTDFVTYVLRADEKLPSKSYIYVALGGDKLVSLPSQDVIASKVAAGNFEVKLGDIKVKGANDDVLGDYIQDIQLFGDGQPLVDIPLVLRFSNGQWTSDYAQKGKAPTFYPYFETFFGARVPNESPKGEVE